MIIVAVAALIGGRLYHVIDQWAALQGRPDQDLPAARTRRPRRLRRDRHRDDRRRTSTSRCKRQPLPALGRHRRPGPVRDAGHRPLGQLLQPGAVRAADDAAVGHRDRLRPPDRGLPVRRRTRSRPPTSSRCSCTSRSPGIVGALVLIWLGSTLRTRLRPGDLLLIFFVWYGIDPVRAREPAPGQLDVLRHPDGPARDARRSSSSAGRAVYRHGPGRPAETAADLLPDHGRRPTAEDDEAAFWEDATDGELADGADEDDADADDDEARPAPTRRRAGDATTQADAEPDGERRDPDDDADEPDPASRLRCRRDPSRRPSAPAPAARTGLAPGARRRARRRRRGSRLARADAGGAAPRSCTGSFGSLPGSSSSSVFRFRIETVRPGAPARRGGYLLVGGGPSGLDGPVPRPPRPAVRAAGLVPRQRARRPSRAAGASASIHRVGGLLPVWRGGIGADQHVASARAVLGNGAVFAQMPEGTVSGPAGTIGPFRVGLGADRAPDRGADRAVRDGRHRGALPRPADGVAGPAGHLGRRAARASTGTASIPAEGTRAELDLAHRLSDALAASSARSSRSSTRGPSIRRADRDGCAAG